jgi:hypothetical protein
MLRTPSGSAYRTSRHGTLSSTGCSRWGNLGGPAPVPALSGLPTLLFLGAPTSKPAAQARLGWNCLARQCFSRLRPPRGAQRRNRHRGSFAHEMVTPPLKMDSLLTPNLALRTNSPKLTMLIVKSVAALRFQWQTVHVPARHGGGSGRAWQDEVQVATERGQAHVVSGQQAARWSVQRNRRGFLLRAPPRSRDNRNGPCAA